MDRYNAALGVTVASMIGLLGTGSPFFLLTLVGASFLVGWEYTKARRTEV